MTLYGNDRSSWDPIPRSLDGMTFVSTKLTDGLGYYINPNAVGCLNAWDSWATPVIGVYHVLWGNRDIGGQAQWLLDTLDARWPRWRQLCHTPGRGFIIQSDNEPFYSEQTPPTIAQINQFGSELVARGRGDFQAAAHLPYSPGWHYGSSVSGLVAPCWWQSSYGQNLQGRYDHVYLQQGGDAGAWWGSVGGRVPYPLQYGSNGSVDTDTTADVNAVRDTLQGLLIRIGYSAAVAAKGHTDMNVYYFGDLADAPASLRSSNKAVYVCTDGTGSYFVRRFSSWQYGSTKLNNVPVVYVALGANVDGQLPLGTTFPDAFRQLTGGCTYAEGVDGGVAPWRQGSGGDVSIAQIDARIAASTVVGSVNPPAAS